MVLLLECMVVAAIHIIIQGYYRILGNKCSFKCIKSYINLPFSLSSYLNVRFIHITILDCLTAFQVIWSRGQISNFEFCCTPQEEKVGNYFQSGTCLGASETHVLLSFLWSIFCKWPVITVTPQTSKVTLHKIQN